MGPEEIGRADVPSEARAELEALVGALTETVRDDLVGVYVHGSVALGCFNAARSDVDVIAVVREPLSDEQRLRLVDALLRISAAPHGIELHVVTRTTLETWEHPARFELHYSETLRERFAFDPVETLARLPATDADLAAHMTVARAVGIALTGPPAAELFPKVPRADLVDSLLRDLEWTRTAPSALYGVLSPCRVWATLETGAVHSKLTGARWALEQLPPDLGAPVERALASYAGAGDPIELAEDERARLWAYIGERVRSIAVSNAAT
jgi:streptomycin 3"-adenylyltransferase